MEGAVLVGVALAGVLVGVLVPVLLEARALLKATRQQVEALGPKLDAVLLEARAATKNLNELSADLTPVGPRVAELTDALAGASAAVHRVRSGINMAAAVGPAVTAAIHAFRAVAAERERDDEAGDDPDTPDPDDKNGA